MPDSTWLLAATWAATIAIETAVLAAGLSPRHDWRVRLFAGAWLSCCTLPIVGLVLPDALPVTVPWPVVVAVAEVFAPLAECGLFWWACIRPRPPDMRATVRDLAAIVVANLASFTAGEVAWRWLGLA